MALISLVSMRFWRWGAWPMQWSICGVRTWPVVSVQFEGQPPCCTKWPTTCQTRVRLFHQNMGAGLHRDRGNALLLPPQHHQGTLRAIPAGDEPGNSCVKLFKAFISDLEHFCIFDRSRLGLEDTNSNLFASKGKAVYYLIYFLWCLRFYSFH